jgi:hypothetical protein
MAGKLEVLSGRCEEGGPRGGLAAPCAQGARISRRRDQPIVRAPPRPFTTVIVLIRPYEYERRSDPFS